MVKPRATPCARAGCFWPPDATKSSSGGPDDCQTHLKARQTLGALGREEEEGTVSSGGCHSL